MTNYIFFVIMFILISICIFLIKDIFSKVKMNKIKSFINILKLIFIMIIIFYIIFCFKQFFLLRKLKNFGTQVSYSLGDYKITYGKYPKNIIKLNNYKGYQERKYYSLWPITHKFNLIGFEKNNKYKYIFYAYGLDGDDDSLKKTYKINFIYALLPPKDGDIILDRDSLKLIKVGEDIFNQKK